MTEVDAKQAISAAYAGEWSRFVSTLIRVTGDWALAEDAAQDAFESAMVRWPRDGIPPNPGAWLTLVARNRAIDRLRRATTERSKLRDLAIMRELDSIDEHEIDDDRLRLIFTACHPALALDARVALTLRSVAGLSTAEIARAFLVSESTMSQRIVRARAKIRHAGIPFRVPEGRALDERVPGVLAVLYLLFTEGYAASSGDRVVREPLAMEAIRVTTILRALLPGVSEIDGLLALMLLQHARRAARTDEHGDLVPLELQNRELWRHEDIAVALDILDAALAGGGVGPYRLQAVIAAEHARSPDWEHTDFASIVRAYDQLAAITPTPVVALNRAVAIGMCDGPQAGLDALAALDGRLVGYFLMPAARADLLRRLGRDDESAAEYRAALTLARTDPERRYLERRLTEVTSAQAATGDSSRSASR